MMNAQDIRDLRFEKAAWGYRPEDVDEFLGKLEATFIEIDNEREDSNHKIQVLADKVREYMKDEEAIKDALLDAQKQGHRIVAEANEKANQILEKAKGEAAILIDEATRQHEIAMQKNAAEIERAHEDLKKARQMVADFKRSLFDMYKEHLEVISAMPEVDTEDGEDSTSSITAEDAKKIIRETVAEVESAGKTSEKESKEKKPTPKKSGDIFSEERFSDKEAEQAFESRFNDILPDPKSEEKTKLDKKSKA